MSRRDADLVNLLRTAGVITASLGVALLAIFLTREALRGSWWVPALIILCGGAQAFMARPLADRWTAEGNESR